LREVFLYVCIRFPHQVRSGLDLRVLSHLHALSKIGELVVFALQGNPETAPKFIDLRVPSDKSILSPVSNIEMLRATSLLNSNLFAHRASKDSISEFLTLVRHIKPNKIIFSRLETTEYFLALDKQAKAKSILDLDESIETFIESIEEQNTLEFPLINRLLLRKQLEYERAILELFPQVWLSSKQEIVRINKNLPRISCYHVPNAVIETGIRPKILAKGAKKLSFSGSFNYLPNQQGLQFLLSNVMENLESHSLTVLGSGLESWSDYANVRFINNPKSILAHLQELDISLIPIFIGAGTRFKALEAMSTGLPVISTAKGVEGLELEPYKEYLPAEQPLDFVARIRELGRDSHLFAKLSINGLQKVRSNHSVSSLVEVFRSIPQIVF